MLQPEMHDSENGTHSANGAETLVLTPNNLVYSEPSSTYYDVINIQNHHNPYHHEHHHSYHNHHQHAQDTTTSNNTTSTDHQYHDTTTPRPPQSQQPAATQLSDPQTNSASMSSHLVEASNFIEQEHIENDENDEEDESEEEEEEEEEEDDDDDDDEDDEDEDDDDVAEDEDDGDDESEDDSEDIVDPGQHCQQQAHFIGRNDIIGDDMIETYGLKNSEDDVLDGERMLEVTRKLVRNTERDPDRDLRKQVLLKTAIKKLPHFMDYTRYSDSLDRSFHTDISPQAYYEHHDSQPKFYNSVQPNAIQMSTTGLRMLDLNDDHDPELLSIDQNHLDPNLAYHNIYYDNGFPPICQKRGPEEDYEERGTKKNRLI